jgi:hypothetical protein
MPPTLVEISPIKRLPVIANRLILLFQTSFPTDEDPLHSYAAVGPQLVPLNESGIFLSLPFLSFSVLQEKKEEKKNGVRKRMVNK